MSVEGRLNAIARERWISTVSHELAPLKKDVTDRAKTGKVGDLSEEVSSELKDGEWSLEKRILGVEKKGMNVPFDPLNGIIAQLTRKCHENVIRQGLSKSHRVVAVGLKYWSSSGQIWC